MVSFLTEGMVEHVNVHQKPNLMRVAADGRYPLPPPLAEECLLLPVPLSPPPPLPLPLPSQRNASLSLSLSASLPLPLSLPPY